MNENIWKEIINMSNWVERFEHIFFNDKYENKLEIFENLLKLFEEKVNNLSDIAKEENKNSIKYNLDSLNWIIECLKNDGDGFREEYDSDNDYIRHLKKKVLFFWENLTSDCSEWIMLYSYIGRKQAWDKLKKFDIDTISKEESSILIEEMKKDKKFWGR